MGSATNKQLGQARPADLNAASIYSPAVGVETRVTTLVICNTTGSAATYRVFHDDNGVTYDESTALYFDETVAANTTIVKSLRVDMADAAGNLAIRTDTANALTFTAYGIETT